MEVGKASHVRQHACRVEPVGFKLFVEGIVLAHLVGVVYEQAFQEAREVVFGVSHQWGMARRGDKNTVRSRLLQNPVVEHTDNVSTGQKVVTEFAGVGILGEWTLDELECFVIDCLAQH